VRLTQERVSALQLERVAKGQRGREVQEAELVRGDATGGEVPGKMSLGE
jgi:hypothetical protein